MNQPAYHGTGNVDVYDRFRYDLVGGPGGEGAQAYGWGLYFAGKKEVADWYRDKLTKDRTVEIPDSVKSAIDILESGAPAKRFLRDVESLRSKNIDWASDWGYTEDKYKDAIAIVNSYLDTKPFSKGKLYQVDIPEDSEYLDWDEWMEEQPNAIKEKIDLAFQEFASI